jgi:hypothetical protein
VIAFLCGLAYMKRDSGLVVRADTIEDSIDSHNFLKNIHQGASIVEQGNGG